jgi:aminoglycoside N3'-acetyltransferase
MLGCGWRNCTQFHYYEELVGVPYRYYKVFSGLADFGDGFKETQCRMFVRNLDIEAKNDFSTAEFELKKRGKIKSIPFCQGRVESVRGADLSLVCKQLLQNDPLTWVKNKELVARKLS